VTSLLFALAFAILGFALFVMLAWAGWGIVHMLRTSQRNQRYLDAARDDEPLRVDHLSPGLRHLAEGTRLLRIALESPIQDVLALGRGEFHEIAAQDLDAFDNMLMDLSRQLTDWVHAVDTLADSDRATLADIGVGAGLVRRALLESGGAFERKHLRDHNSVPMHRRLRQIADELLRIESSLQVVSPGPYR